MILTLLLLVAAVATGLNGGVFFAFSTFVMRAFGRLPAPQGIAAMQAINVTALGWPLMLLMFGTAALCLVLAVVALFRLGEPGGVLILVGAIVFVAGTIVVTMLRNVPLNDALARADAASGEGAALWTRYLTGALDYGP